MRTSRPHQTCQGRVGRGVTLSFPALVLGFYNVSQGNDLLFSAIYVLLFLAAGKDGSPMGVVQRGGA